jgi:hypothetical protein
MRVERRRPDATNPLERRLIRRHGLSASVARALADLRNIVAD